MTYYVNQEENTMKNKQSDPFLQLLNSTRELQILQSNLRIYKEKEKTVRRRLQVKRRKMEKYHSFISQKQSKEAYQGTTCQTKKDVQEKENLRHRKYHSPHFSQHVDVFSGSEIFKNMPSQKQRYQHFKKMRAIEGRLSRKNNEERKQLEQIQNLNAKRQKKENINQFEKTLPIRKKLYLSNYLERVKSQQNGLASLFNSQAQRQLKSMKKLKREKSCLIKSINHYNKQETQLYDRYGKILKTRNSYILDCMVKNVVAD